MYTYKKYFKLRGDFCNFLQPSCGHHLMLFSKKNRCGNPTYLMLFIQFDKSKNLQDSKELNNDGSRCLNCLIVVVVAKVRRDLKHFRRRLRRSWRSRPRPRSVSCTAVRHVWSCSIATPSMDWWTKLLSEFRRKSTADAGNCLVLSLLSRRLRGRYRSPSGRLWN